MADVAGIVTDGLEVTALEIGILRLAQARLGQARVLSEQRGADQPTEALVLPAASRT
jgi:hypothetical protein